MPRFGLGHRSWKVSKIAVRAAPSSTDRSSCAAAAGRRGAARVARSSAASKRGEHPAPGRVAVRVGRRTAPPDSRGAPRRHRRRSPPPSSSAAWARSTSSAVRSHASPSSSALLLRRAPTPRSAGRTCFSRSSSWPAAGRSRGCRPVTSSTIAGPAVPLRPDRLDVDLVPGQLGQASGRRARCFSNESRLAVRPRHRRRRRRRARSAQRPIRVLELAEPPGVRETEHVGPAVTAVGAPRRLPTSGR